MAQEFTRLGLHSGLDRIGSLTNQVTREYGIQTFAFDVVGAGNGTNLVDTGIACPNSGIVIYSTLNIITEATGVLGDINVGTTNVSAHFIEQAVDVGTEGLFGGQIPNANDQNHRVLGGTFDYQFDNAADDFVGQVLVAILTDVPIIGG